MRGWLPESVRVGFVGVVDGFDQGVVLLEVLASMPQSAPFTHIQSHPFHSLGTERHRRSHPGELSHQRVLGRFVPTGCSGLLSHGSFGLPLLMSWFQHIIRLMMGHGC